MAQWLQRRFGQVRRLGLRQSAQLAGRRALASLRMRLHELQCRFRPSGLRSWHDEQPVRRCVGALSLPCDGAEAAWLAHTFDLLGSRPVRLARQGPVQGLPKCWRGTMGRLQALLPEDWSWIEWHFDPVMSHRWPMRHRRRLHVCANGADVKRPWELSRLQHLPALAGRIAGASPPAASSFADEIRNQLIDFIAQNPPGFGVNWMCPMDVAIRAANAALAVDLARAGGAAFDEPFLKAIASTLRDHGRFLVGTLEWKGTLSTNHYLADLAGLLFCGLYLHGREADEWVVFAGRALLHEVEYQFHPSGANFEASTAYHRLSSEIAVYAVAMMLHCARERPELAARWWSGATRRIGTAPAPGPVQPGRSAEGVEIPIDGHLSARLSGMARFTRSLLRSDGSVPLIGDDDSGRFVRLLQVRDASADLRDHRHLIAAVAAMYVPEGDASNATAESSWLRTLVGSAAMERQIAQDAGASSLSWPDFGLQVWSQGSWRITLRCGAFGQGGIGGHAHSDQLAITVDLDGIALVVDPGTGCYTSSVEQRNLLRSAAVHSCPQVDGVEPNRWHKGLSGLFALEDRSHGRLKQVDAHGGCFTHVGFGGEVTRSVVIEQDTVTITDTFAEQPNGAGTLLVLAPSLQATLEQGRVVLRDANGEELLQFECSNASLVRVPFSASYGSCSTTWAIRVEARGGRSEVRLRRTV